MSCQSPDLTLRAVKRPEILDMSLQERARAGGQTKYTELFVGIHKGEEVGLLSIDFIPNEEQLGLYEIYVLHEHRRTGVGTFLLEQAEQLGKHRGYGSVVLNPKPLDERQTKSKLIQWYKQRGYLKISASDGRMRKVLR